MYWLVSYEREYGDGFGYSNNKLDGYTTSDYLRAVTRFNLFDMSSRRLCRFDLNTFCKLLKSGQTKNIWLQDGCNELFGENNTYNSFIGRCNIRSIDPIKCVLRYPDSGKAYYTDKFNLAVIEYTPDYLVALNYLGRVKHMSFDDAIIQFSARNYEVLSNVGINDIKLISRGRSISVEDHAKLTYIQSSKEHIDIIEKSNRANQIKDITSSGGYHIGSNGVLTITSEPESIVCKNCSEVVMSRDDSFERLKIVDIAGTCKELPDRFASRALNLSAIRLPIDIRKIGSQSFNWTSIEKLDLRVYTKLRTIRWESFCNNGKLKEVYLPDNLTRVVQTFMNNPKLETILLPRNCKEVSKDIFHSNTSLKRIGLPVERFRLSPSYYKSDSPLRQLEELYTTKENYDMALEIAQLSGHSITIRVGNRT